MDAYLTQTTKIKVIAALLKEETEKLEQMRRDYTEAAEIFYNANKNYNAKGDPDNPGTSLEI